MQKWSKNCLIYFKNSEANHVDSIVITDESVANYINQM